MSFDAEPGTGTTSFPLAPGSLLQSVGPGSLPRFDVGSSAMARKTRDTETAPPPAVAVPASLPAQAPLPSRASSPADPPSSYLQPGFEPPPLFRTFPKPLVAPSAPHDQAA